MKFLWKNAFTETGITWSDDGAIQSTAATRTLCELKTLLDFIHIRMCLLKPYYEVSDYPPVESRELLPSFEADLWEHKLLPGFSLVAFERQLEYFDEVFQYDALRYPLKKAGAPPENAAVSRNVLVLQSRLPKPLQESLRQSYAKTDITDLGQYPMLLRYLLQMDRAQVIALSPGEKDEARFYLAGVFASFPSDFDTEVKRYGLRINKFAIGDSERYEQNRQFVCQHLMELYGFPVVSERRTSAALFARRLYKMDERFLVRVLGQSDRTITTLWNDSAAGSYYPHVEKIALVSLDPEHEELLAELRRGGYMIDPARRVVIMRVRYKQHKFNANNVRQERALSVESHEILHPVTGFALTNITVLRDSSNMFVRLNDIVRGEYTGRIVFKRTEIIENTDTDEKRLKFLHAWLTKHQRRIIGYGDDFYANISKILDDYLNPVDPNDAFAVLHELHQDVLAKVSYIQQARKVRVLEDLKERSYKGGRISYQQMLEESVAQLHNLKFEIVKYFDTLVTTAITIAEEMLNDTYLRRRYIEKKDTQLSRRGVEIKKTYGKLVSLVDELKAIKQSRSEPQ